MKLERDLIGVTFECPKQATKEKPQIVQCTLDINNYSSREIDELFSKSKTNKESLYNIDITTLEALLPDLIFTQDTCEVCQIDTKRVTEAIERLPKKVEIVPISPRSLQDVLKTPYLIASKMGQPLQADPYVKSLMKRINHITHITQQNNPPPNKKIALLEWIDPIFNCGHWIPDQINIAGGHDALSTPNGNSRRIPWSNILDYNPEFIIIAPCGYRTDRTLMDIPRLANNPRWNQLQAVQKKQVYLIDFEAFTQPSASTLTDGMELLASIFHPNHFTLPERLASKVVRLDQ